MELFESDGRILIEAAALEQYLQNLINGIEAECSGVPAGCDETRAYLYGEICVLKLLRKHAEKWAVRVTAEDPQKSNDD